MDGREPSDESRQARAPDGDQPARPALLPMDTRAGHLPAQADVADVFLRGSSEALRTRITTVKGFAQLLRRHVLERQLDTRRLETLSGHLEQEVLAFEGTLLQLLRVQELQWRPDVLRFEPLDLRQLADSVVARYGAAPEWTERHALRMEQPAAISGQWDPAWLAEALGALLSNALKYTPRGGEIRVSVRREGEQAVVSVTDPGIGLPRTSIERARLLLPFVRGEAARQLASGLGLGLFVVDCVARGHGGDVELASNPPHGSVITMRLPLQPPPRPAA
jgi:signal transduction histidine kinase